MTSVLLLLAWLAVSVISINVVDRCLRVFILDYEVKRPRIMKTVVTIVLWLMTSIAVLVAVLG